jgi:hypothetical protein
MNYNIDFPQIPAVDLDSYFREQLVYFFFNFTKKSVNSTCLNELSQQLYSVLELLKNTLQNDNENKLWQNDLELFYRMIGHTRFEKGEHDVSYMLLLTFYDVFPTLAIYALHRFVQPVNDNSYGSCEANPYGSWRDMKHLCHYISIQTGSQKHAIIDTCIQLMNSQLARDVESWKYSHYHSREHISNVAKWIPREHKKFDWLYERLVIDWAKTHYPYIMRTPYDYDSYIRAILKCKRLYRKTITMLNKALDTTEIKQCSRNLIEIIPSHVSKFTLMKQKQLMYSEPFREHITYDLDQQTKQCSQFNIKISELVKEAIRLSTLPHDHNRSVLNNMWTRFSKSYKNYKFENMIPLLDVSYYNKMLDSESYYNAIGLAILIAEHSSFGYRIMMVDNQPTWINVLNNVSNNILNGDDDNNSDFISKVENIILVAGSTTFRLDKAIDMIQFSAIMTGYSTQNLSFVLLSNQCSQLSYNKIVSADIGSIVLWNLSTIENIHDLPNIDTSRLILLSGFSNNYFQILMSLNKNNKHKKHNAFDLYITPYNTVCQILENPKYNVLGDYLNKLMH